MQECEAQSDLRGLHLPSLLIMPVQRVPRYELLLRDLCHHTSTVHPDFDTLQKCLNEVQKVCASLNESKRIHENQEKVHDVSARLGHRCEGLVAPQRLFVSEDDVVTDSLVFCAPQGRCADKLSAFDLEEWANLC